MEKSWSYPEIFISLAVFLCSIMDRTCSENATMVNLRMNTVFPLIEPPPPPDYISLPKIVAGRRTERKHIIPGGSIFISRSKFLIKVTECQGFSIKFIESRMQLIGACIKSCLKTTKKRCVQSTTIRFHSLSPCSFG